MISLTIIGDLYYKNSGMTLYGFFSIIGLLIFILVLDWLTRDTKKGYYLPKKELDLKNYTLSISKHDSLETKELKKTSLVVKAMAVFVSVLLLIIPFNELIAFSRYLF